MPRAAWRTVRTATMNRTSAIFATAVSNAVVLAAGAVAVWMAVSMALLAATPAQAQSSVESKAVADKPQKDGRFAPKTPAKLEPSA